MYQASDMVIAININSSYINEPKAQSRVVGNHFFSSNSDFLPNNGAVLFVFNSGHRNQVSCSLLGGFSKPIAEVIQLLDSSLT